MKTINLKKKDIIKDLLFFKESVKVYKKIKNKINPLKFQYFKFNKTKIIIADDTSQILSSYKIRGSTNEIFELDSKHKDISLCTTGNFGLAISYLCQKNKLSCNVFVPNFTSIAKIRKLEKYGAAVFSKNLNYDEAKKNAKLFAKKNKIKFLDTCTKNIYLGNASYVLNIIEELKKKDKNFLRKKILAIFPLGNGSFALPSIKILKNLNKDINIALVEPSKFSKLFYYHCKKNKPNYSRSVADGAAVKSLSKKKYKFFINNADIISRASEMDIKKSMKFLKIKFGIKSEGAGALAMSFALLNKKKLNNYNYVIVPVCGSSIDDKKFFQIIKNIKELTF